MEKHRIEFNIGRFDHYYDSINNKTNVILGLNTFLIGGLIALYPFLFDEVLCTIWLHINIGIIILTGLFCIVMMLIASIPYLSEDGNSLMYFQDIKKLGEEKYKEKSKEQTEDELLEDLREQSFLLATGLSKKFNRLKLAYYLCIFQVIMLIPLIIQVLTHFKK